MKQIDDYSAVLLTGEDALALDRFATACETDESTILLLVDEGLIYPEAQANVFCFDGQALARARLVLRLQRDFEANLQSVAVMVDLLDENARLLKQLRIFQKNMMQP